MGMLKLSKKKSTSYLTIILLSIMIYLGSVIGASMLLGFTVDANNLIFGMVAIFISTVAWALLDRK